MMAPPQTAPQPSFFLDDRERADEYQRKADSMRARALEALEPAARAAFHQMAIGYELWVERLLKALPSRSRV